MGGLFNVSDNTLERIGWADAKMNVRADAYQRGPYLKDGLIIVPSFRYNQRLVDGLKPLGFYFRDCSISPDWVRPVNKPYRGKVYTAAAWLRRVMPEYRAAWPQWEPPEEGGEG